jgi:hypothetical protein
MASIIQNGVIIHVFTGKTLPLTLEKLPLGLQLFTFLQLPI